ncbi:uncharacterized protein UMAG_11702 [Mycosarcoma maydis]|uniref:BAR domain-containing protein n=1 Tax=Mycosarcoma maydis TaxID=5270 RepID=A0A0D1E0R7_MYCMD|nr:uncharacterized protein UMAG_11702 [Ustilago maydis 521]KIS69799.1 hypothetical protein UMAG_11702 [Ustilago maydis 521]|eukprot:XP_011388876.1 hypothetical protein UMAG_11702 [Ustilago maydis 521]
MPSLTPTKSMLPKRPQLGKIRSWSAGLSSMLSSSTPSEEDDISFQVEQRKKGIESLYTSTEAYWSYLGKKKPIPFDASSLSVSENSATNGAKSESKVLPVEALGLAMGCYATAFPSDSTYGSCLGLLGDAHIQLANLQSTFTKDTSHIFLARIARSKAILDSFTAALKKLDLVTARLESAQTKVQKSKKEKRELEEELRQAKAAYDEAVMDVEARGGAVQDSEAEDWLCLTDYMQAQLDYLGQAQAVMEHVKAAWSAPPTGSETPSTRPRSLSQPKNRPSISRQSTAKDATEVTPNRFASPSSLSLSNSDRPSTEESTKEKRRLRMPSFTTGSKASEAVASVTCSFGRARGSAFFGASGETSPEKDSKWNFMRKKEPGFMSMDQPESQPSPALPTRRNVSATDVSLGALESHDQPDICYGLVDDIEVGMLHHRASPFSPGTSSEGFLSGTHETIHERGESQLSAEMHGLDHGFLCTAPVGLQYTGLSAYSEGADPFGGGGAPVLSPQQTGYATDDDDEVERQGLTRNATASKAQAGWRNVLNGTLLAANANSDKSSKARLPPPVPSSAAYLSKSKARPPPPPPLPSRNSS